MRALFVYEVLNQHNGKTMLLEKEELKWANSIVKPILTKFNEVRSKVKEKKNIFSTQKQLNEFLKQFKSKFTYDASEVLYFENFDIKLGYLIMSMLQEMRTIEKEISKEHLAEIEKLLTEILSTNSFPKESEKYLNRKEVVVVRFVYNKQKLFSNESITLGSMAEGLLTLNVAYNPEEIEEIIKHELQHNTQQKNQVYLGIGRMCRKNKDKIKDLTLKEFYNIIDTGANMGRKIIFGGGKTKTHLSQHNPASASTKEKEKAYFGDDREYYPWISMKITEYIKKYKKNIAGKSVDDAVNLLTKEILKDDEIKKIKKYRKEAINDIMNLLRTKLEKAKEGK